MGKIMKACKEDIKKIMSIVREIKEEMAACGSDQWCEAYPLAENFEADIEAKNLYVYRLNSVIKGFVCIDEDEGENYRDIKFSRVGGAKVIHRLAVCKTCRKDGIAKQFIEFAEKLARRDQLDYIKVDTYTLNKGAMRLFQKQGFKHVGDFMLGEKVNKFHVYEKKIEG